MERYSRTKIIKMFLAMSLTSSPPLSMNDSCSALLQGPTNFPEHPLGPRPTRLPQGAPAQQCRPNLLLLCDEEWDRAKRVRFLSAESIHPNKCHCWSGTGEWRGAENVRTGFSSQKHLPKSFKYLLGLQRTLFCIDSLVAVCSPRGTGVISETS